MPGEAGTSARTPQVASPHRRLPPQQWSLSAPTRITLHQTPSPVTSLLLAGTSAPAILPAFQPGDNMPGLSALPPAALGVHGCGPPRPWDSLARGSAGWWRARILSANPQPPGPAEELGLPEGPWPACPPAQLAALWQEASGIPGLVWGLQSDNAPFPCHGLHSQRTRFSAWSPPSGLGLTQLPGAPLSLSLCLGCTWADGSGTVDHQKHA